MKKQIYKLIPFWLLLSLAVVFLSSTAEKNTAQQGQAHFILQGHLLSKKNAQIKELNQAIPSEFDYLDLLAVRNKQGGLSDRLLSYYLKVAEIMPQMADAYAMLGYCYYYQHQTQKAIESYAKAISFNPSFFWNYYNLSAILLENGLADPAAKVMSQAVGLDPKATLINMYSSKIYRDIMVFNQDKNYDYPGQLLNAYQSIAQHINSKANKTESRDMSVRIF